MLSKPIKLSTFHLHAPIGHGAMGMVWQGEHAFEKTPVAIKVIMPHRAQEARYAQLFRREVRAIAALDHPGIIRIYDHGIIDAAAATRSQGRLIEGSPYLVMEWSPLKPLASPSNPVPHWNALKSVLLGILDVLAHVHARGIIHRDLKPANVLADPLKLGIQGLKVIDFGLARIHSLLGASTQEAGGVVGTPGYMAPEQRSYAQLHTQGPWTDLYALGRVAWWLSMQNPNMRDPEQVYQTLNKPHALNPRFEIPEGFQDWLRCLLVPQPYLRTCRAADAAAALCGLPNICSTSPTRVEVPLSQQETQSLSITATSWLTSDDVSSGDIDLGDTDIDLDDTSIDSSAPPEPHAIPAFPSVWARATRQRAPLQGAGLHLYTLHDIAFIARDQERTSLWESLKRVASEHQPEIVAIQGPAGVGKTRLARWMCERSHALGAATPCVATHQPNTVPGQALQEMLQRLLLTSRVLPPDPQEYLRTYFAQTSKKGAQAWSQLDLQALSEWLVPHPRTSPYRLVRDTRYHITLKVLRHEAARRPVIMWIDDAQWGPDTLRFCAYASTHNATQDLPLLFVITAQSEALSGLPNRAQQLRALLDNTHIHSTHMELGPLPQESHRDLINSLLHLDGGLTQQILARTKGNPLFSLQLVADWIARDLLEAHNEGFALKPHAQAHLPDDLYTVWKARLEPLLTTEEERRALELAAALGQQIAEQEWHAACDQANIATSVSDAAVERLLDHRLLSTTPTGWRFVHGMLHESIERMSQEAGRYAEHHQTCATVLQARKAQHMRHHIERIGRHLQSSGDYAAATSPLLEGAAEREQTGDFDVLRDLLARWESCLNALQVPADDPRWAEGWLRRIICNVVEGRFQEADTLSARALDILHNTTHHDELHAEIMLARGMVLQVTCQYEEAHDLHHKALEFADRASALPIRARALQGLGRVHYFEKRYDEAEQYYAQAAPLFQQLGDRHGLSGNFLVRARLAFERGQYDDSRAHFQQVIALSDDLGDRYHLCRALNGLANVFHIQNEHDQAEALYRQLLPLAQSIGGRFQLMVKGILAVLLVEKGQHQEALDLIQPFPQGIERHDKSTLGALAALCSALAGLHDWDALDRHLKPIEDYMRTTPDLRSDVAFGLEIAAGVAVEAAPPELARRTCVLAEAVWRCVGQHERADRVAAMLS